MGGENLGWDAVDGIQEREVRRGRAKRKPASPRNIGVDETPFQKWRDYVTVILDKDGSTVLDVLQDRKAEKLGDWFGSPGMTDLKRLKSISMGMWDPYIKAVRESSENREGMDAFDRYHVAQRLYKAVDKMLARERRELVEEHGASELSGTKFEWLRPA